MRTSRYLVVLSAVVAATSIALATSARGTDLPPDPIPAPPHVPPSASAPAPIGTLSPSNPVLGPGNGFKGAINDPTPLPLVNSPTPFVCAAECKEFTFGVDRSIGMSSFLVAIRNNVTNPDGSFNANDGFDLYVYGPSGSLVASANGIGANGQAVTVNNPGAGKYTIVVTFTYAEDPNANYSGEVRLMSGSSWTPPPCSAVSGMTGCYDLPQLRALPPYDLAVSGLPPVASTPLGFPFPVSTPTPTSCYVDETLPIDDPSAGGVQNPTLRCLRFTSDVQNVGAGPLEIRIPLVNAGSGGVSSAYLPGECQAVQVLSAPSGGTATRAAGPCEFHLQHAHFHYSDLLAYTLYGVTSTGGIGPAVASSVKASFCLTGDDYFGYGSAWPNGPRDFVGQPGCNLPASVGPGSTFVHEGINPGWGDVYTWDTPGQYIDITHVPNGTYDLVEKTNPSGALAVAGPAQACSLTQLTLTASAVTVKAMVPSVNCPS